MKRAAIYCRVSTEEQAEKFGLSSQLTELRALAARQGYTIPAGAEFLDDGYSGADLERPALAQLREAANARAFDVLLVHDPDRLSRRLVHQLLLTEEFERDGVQLEFVTTPREETPEGRLLLNVKGIIAEYEREKIRERTLRGKREARRGLVPAGPTPYGYRPDSAAPGKLVPHEETASVVRMIFQWLVEEQRSIRQITTELQALGIRPPRSHHWAKSTVRRILTNEVYAGLAYFNRRERLSGGPLRFRPSQEWVPIEVPALIPQGLWEAAQAQLRRNRTLMTGKPPARFYLLRGLLRCGACSWKLIGVPSHGRRVYRCRGRDRTVILPGQDRCHARTVSADRLEGLIWEAVVGVLRQPALVAERFEAYRVKLGAREVEVRSEAQHLERQLADLERQESKLLDLYLHEDLRIPLLRARVEEFRRQRQELEGRLARARERLVHQEAEAVHRDAVRQFCRLALRGLHRLTPEGRQRLLQALVDEVVLREETVEIHGVLPGRFPAPGQDHYRPEYPHDRPAGRGEDHAGPATSHHPASPDAGGGH